jgi:hypothetical protein
LSEHVIRRHVTDQHGLGVKAAFGCIRSDGARTDDRQAVPFGKVDVFFHSRQLLRIYQRPEIEIPVGRAGL